VHGLGEGISGRQADCQTDRIPREKCTQDSSYPTAVRQNLQGEVWNHARAHPIHKNVLGNGPRRRQAPESGADGDVPIADRNHVE